MARPRPVELVGPDPGQRGQLGVIGQIGRLEQAGAGLDRAHRIGLVGAVHPGAHPAVRVIDAEAVVVAEHAAQAGDQERARGAARARARGSSTGKSQGWPSGLVRDGGAPIA